MATFWKTWGNFKRQVFTLAVVAWTTATYGLSYSAHAQNAVLLDKGVCSNQAVVFGYDWLKSRDKHTGLFFLKQLDGQTAVIEAIDSLLPFQDQAHIDIISHGSPGEISGIPGKDFANILKEHHPATPASVRLMICKGAAASTDGPSLQQSISFVYPLKEAAPGNTSIPVISAAALSCSLVGKVAIGDPGIKSISEALFKQGARKGPEYKTLAKQLTESWEKTPYPGSKEGKTFKTYCNDTVLAVPEKHLPGFIEQTIKTYGDTYLKLINQRFSGADLYSCGAMKNLDNPCKAFK